MKFPENFAFKRKLLSGVGFITLFLRNHSAVASIPDRPPQAPAEFNRISFSLPLTLEEIVLFNSRSTFEIKQFLQRKGVYLDKYSTYKIYSENENVNFSCFDCIVSKYNSSEIRQAGLNERSQP